MAARVLGGMVILWAAAGALVFTQESPPGPAAPASSFDVAVGLPPSGPHSVELSFGEGGIVLDLPAGCTFPLDFEAASGGLLRRGRAEAPVADRQRLVLTLASGRLDHIAYEPDRVVLSFVRRLSVMGGAAGTAAPEGAGAGEYRLGVDDRIAISVNGQPELTLEVAVSGAGTVTAPLVGEVAAKGLTARDLAVRLTDLLEQDYMVDPRVNVQVVEYRSQWVVVTGAIRTPGRVVLRAGFDVKTAISEAGGVLEEAGATIVLSRTTPGTGETERVTISRAALERGESGPLLRHGDVILVQPAQFCFFQGEVRVTGKVMLEPGLTLLRALSIAGMTEWANRKSVEIRREGGGDRRVYNLNAIESRKIEDPVLEGGDLVIVRRRFL